MVFNGGVGSGQHLHYPPSHAVCDDCEELHHGDCPIHGPLLSLDTSSGHDKASLTFTSVPVPSELTVKHSSIPGAGLGVFAKTLVPRGVRFGPYEGRKILKESVRSGTDTSYMWEVSIGHINFVMTELQFCMYLLVDIGRWAVVLH